MWAARGSGRRRERGSQGGPNISEKKMMGSMSPSGRAPTPTQSLHANQLAVVSKEDYLHADVEQRAALRSSDRLLGERHPDFLHGPSVGDLLVCEDQHEVEHLMGLDVLTFG